MCMRNSRVEPIFLLSCGSFNPVTVMHMRMMELARDKIEESYLPTQPLSKDSYEAECTNKTVTNPGHRKVVVGGIFSPVSDLYGKKGLLPASVRIELTRLACNSTSDWLTVSNWECCQPNWSRTRVVLDHIQTALESVYSDLCNSKAAECISILKNKPYVESDSYHHLVVTVDEQVKKSSLEGMSTNSWLMNCLMSIEPPENNHKAECTGNQSYTNDYENNNSSTFSSYEKCDYRHKSESTKFWLSKPHVKFVCGSDLLQSFSTPNLWALDDLDTIIGKYGVVCITRPSYDATKIIHESEILNKYKDNIEFATDGCQNSLSSTLVRAALCHGKSVRYLVPECTLEYIYTHNLYGAKRRNVGLRNRCE
uniref:Nicotinamide-nucleotide adenylyltransferase n=1 Tax=Trichobilharzia regenti TaxID=157069 RepID=A0AA85KH95_TRIRE|nr:unnamed protein product [Trichobilharzia regenti]